MQLLGRLGDELPRMICELYTIIDLKVSNGGNPRVFFDNQES